MKRPPGKATDVDRRLPRRFEGGRHVRPCHLDLESGIESADMIDLDALPIDRFNVALQCSLHHSSMQQVNGVLLPFLGLLRKSASLLRWYGLEGIRPSRNHVLGAVFSSN
jgi:hypothetical protein